MGESGLAVWEGRAHISRPDDGRTHLVHSMVLGRYRKNTTWILRTPRWDSGELQLESLDLSCMYVLSLSCLTLRAVFSVYLQKRQFLWRGTWPLRLLAVYFSFGGLSAYLKDCLVLSRYISRCISTWLLACLVTTAARNSQDVCDSAGLHF